MFYIISLFISLSHSIALGSDHYQMFTTNDFKNINKDDFPQLSISLIPDINNEFQTNDCNIIQVESDSNKLPNPLKPLLKNKKNSVILVQPQDNQPDTIYVVQQSQGQAGWDLLAALTVHAINQAQLKSFVYLRNNNPLFEEYLMGLHCAQYQSSQEYPNIQWLIHCPEDIRLILNSPLLMDMKFRKLSQINRNLLELWDKKELQEKVHQFFAIFIRIINGLFTSNRLFDHIAYDQLTGKLYTDSRKQTLDASTPIQELSDVFAAMFPETLPKPTNNISLSFFQKFKALRIKNASYLHYFAIGISILCIILIIFRISFFKNKLT
jgi:hypothetical protein